MFECPLYTTMWIKNIGFKFCTVVMEKNVIIMIAVFSYFILAVPEI